jgi:hypothetical protein
MNRGSSTECQLTQLSRHFSRFGPLEESPPWLTAEIDQHMAAVRDCLHRDGLAVDRNTLTEYMRGFLDGTRERGWDSASSDYDWETLRLIAICRLAMDCGFVH